MRRYMVVIGGRVMHSNCRRFSEAKRWAIEHGYTCFAIVKLEYIKDYEGEIIYG